MKSNSKEEAEHKTSHQFLEVKLFLLLSQVGEKTQKNIEPIMDRMRDMRFKVTLAECPGGCFALCLPFQAVGDENAASMERSKNVPSECATDVVLAVVFLDVLEISRVIDNMHAKERNCHFVCSSVPLVQGVPGLAASRAICFELVKVSCKRLPFWTSNPFRIGGA